MENIRLIHSGDPLLLEPVTCCRAPLEIELGGSNLHKLLMERWTVAAAADPGILSVKSDFWPSRALAERLAAVKGFFTLFANDGTPLAWRSKVSDFPDPEVPVFDTDSESFRIVYPWHILKINEDVMSSITRNCIDGTVREGATVDGILLLGKDSVVLPGVYIEGVVIIGRNCKIGPNCYLRGYTSIGDSCHIGQSVEIKNSILMDNVGAGHLTYIGDSIVGSNTNFGAGTIISNFRHDAKNHRSMVKGKLVDTERRKFGAIIGDNVHTGIHTSIYPGRKIWANAQTRPGEIVQRDIVL